MQRRLRQARRRPAHRNPGAFTVGIVLWLIYGIATHQMPVILANLATLALQCAIIYLKLRYARAP